MLRVILADDDAAVREELRGWLETCGAPVRLVAEASDGEMALVKVRDMCPDILITDVVMPFMDGVALTEQVKRSFPWTQVMIITRLDDPDRAEQARRAGAMEYLLKPVVSYEFQEALRRMVRRVDEARECMTRLLRSRAEAISDVRRESERRVLRWLSGGEPIQPWQRPCRMLLLPVNETDCADAAMTGMRLMERRHALPVDMFALRTPQGPALVIAGDEIGALEECAYAAADCICRAAEWGRVGRVHVRISRYADGSDGLRRVYRDLVGLDAMGRGIYADGDALRRVFGMRHTVSPLTERLLDAEAGELKALLDDILRSGADAPGIVVDAVRQLALESGAPEAFMPSDDPDELLDMMQRAVRIRDLNAPTLAASPLSRARSFVARRYAMPGLLIYEAARAAGMSEARFRVVFRQEMGRTFTEYLLEMRLFVACVLLRTTRMRVSNIARLVGYSEPSYFDKLFGIYIGVSPAQYRRGAAPAPRSGN